MRIAVVVALLLTAVLIVVSFAAADLRWTVDTPEDLALVRRLYDELGLAEPSAA